MQTETDRLFLRRLSQGDTLERDEAFRFFCSVMEGQVSEIELASALTAMHLRGEDPAELRGAAEAARASMIALPEVPPDAIDVCGTGGDNLGTRNVSTAVAFVLAALGVPVAKHGNRGVTSVAGASDTLAALGVEASTDIAQQSRRLVRQNFAYLPAPLYHPAMRYAAPVRHSLGFRTLFNFLGPLCNPARVDRQLVGVSDRAWVEPMADVMGQLGSLCAWIVCSETDQGPADEITLAGPTHIAAWEAGEVRKLTFRPEMAGMLRQPIAAIKGAAAAENAQAIIALFEGKKDAYRETVLLNVAVGLHIAGRGNILEDGGIETSRLKANISCAARAIDEGGAMRALNNAREKVEPFSAAP